MKQVYKIISRTVIALTLSVMLIFSSASGLFAVEIDSQAILTCEATEILDNSLIDALETIVSSPPSLEESPSEAPQNSANKLEVPGSAGAPNVENECPVSKEKLSAPALENSKEITSLEDLYNCGTLESHSLDTNYRRLEFFIGSIAAYMSGDLIVSASTDVALPVDWCPIFYRIPLEILTELALPVENYTMPPTGDYLPPIFMTSFRTDGVRVFQFVIQPIDNLSANISASPFGVFDSFWFDGLYIGQIVTLETILEAIYERTGFNGEGFGIPTIREPSDATNYVEYYS